MRTRDLLPVFAAAAVCGASALAQADVALEPPFSRPPSMDTVAAVAPAQTPAVGDGVWDSVHRFFTWKHGQAGVYPIAEVDVGRKSSVGVALFDRGTFHSANEIRLSVAGAFDGLVEVHALDRLNLFSENGGGIYLRGLYRRRPDGIFYGLGEETRSSDKTFFFLVEPEVAVGADRALGDLARVQVEAGYRQLDFDSSNFSDDTDSLDQRFGGSGQASLPPGYDGYGLLGARAGLTLDSRGRARVGSGVRLAADAGYALDPGDSATSLVSWGGEVGSVVDFSGRGHALGLAVSARFIEGLGDNPVPFTELASLGGRTALRAFLPGRLRGDSSVVGTLNYQQPIAGVLDAELFLEAGNVFPDRLSGLSARHLFASYGLRLETSFSREVTVGLLAGFGSTQMDAPDFKAADEFRFNLGVNHAF